MDTASLLVDSLLPSVAQSAAARGRKEGSGAGGGGTRGSGGGTMSRLPPLCDPARLGTLLHDMAAALGMEHLDE